MSEATSNPRPVVNCDNEVWIKEIVLTAMRMAVSIHTTNRGRAPLVQCGFDGIANGAAVEIIHTLGMEPEYINLTRPPTLQ